MLRNKKAFVSFLVFSFLLLPFDLVFAIGHVEPFDYCRAPEEVSEPDDSESKREIVAGNPQSDNSTRPRTATAGNAFGLSQQCSAREFKNMPSSIDMLVVPVGFEFPADSQVFHDHIGLLRRVYRDFDVSFGYFDCSVPIGITSMAGNTVVWANTMDVLAFNSLLKAKEISADKLIFIVNSNDQLGTAYFSSGYMIFSAGQPYSYYAAIHETAHLLSVNDGYESTYKFSDSNPGNSELFLSVDGLPERIQGAHKAIRPEIEQVGVCNGEPLYAIKSGEHIRNIMRTNPKNNDLLDLLREGSRFFNDVQVFLMKQYIRESTSQLE